MSVVIKINGTDRSSLIDYKSVNLQRILTSRVDTLSFAIKRYGSKTFKPYVLDEIELLEDGVKLFGGVVVETNETVEGSNIETIHVQCKDHTHTFDRQLVIKVYENTTVDDIIDDIVTNFTDGSFTTTQVDAPVTVSYVAFNYEQPSKVLQQLANLIGYEWYIDPDKDIVFKNRAITSAPFGLTDTNGTYFYNTLAIKRTIKNLRNTTYVRGGTFRGDPFTEEQEADGDKLTYTQGFRYSNITCEVDSVPKTIGVDNIDDPASFDVLYNFNEKALKFKSANKPTAGQVVKVVGNPHIPVIVLEKENVSISNFGTFQYKVIDKSLNSKEGARERATQEHLQWSEELNEGGFTTLSTGLDVSQQINIQSTKRNINENFIISRIVSRMHTKSQMVHNVTIVSTLTFRSIEWFQQLLVEKDKEIEINADEVLDKIESALETITLAEAVALSTDHNKQTETINVAEVATPTIDKNITFGLAPCATTPFLLDKSPMSEIGGTYVCL